MTSRCSASPSTERPIGSRKRSRPKNSSISSIRGTSQAHHSRQLARCWIYTTSIRRTRCSTSPSRTVCPAHTRRPAARHPWPRPPSASRCSTQGPCAIRSAFWSCGPLTWLKRALMFTRSSPSLKSCFIPRKATSSPGILTICAGAAGFLP